MGTALPKLAAPARRALAGCGIASLEDLGGLTEDEVRSLHGMGPNAMRQVRAALEGAGLDFADPV